MRRPTLPAARLRHALQPLRSDRARALLGALVLLATAPPALLLALGPSAAAPGVERAAATPRPGGTGARRTAAAPPTTAAPLTTAAPPTTAAAPTSSAPPRPGAPDAPITPSPPPQHAVRYRIVGCRSDGTQAYRSGPPRREVAFGFDDGPWSDTDAFVRMLERNRAQATFFMIGEQITVRYRGTLLRELRDGDVLGDHTFTHPYLTHVADVQGELQRTVAAIRSLSGYTPCVFRPPYGAYDASVVRTARSLGLATVLWDVDPADYTLPGSAVIARRVLAQVTPGSIVISHDGGGPRLQTLAAYPTIIATLRRRGYRIVTIPELLGFHPVYRRCVLLCDGLGLPRARLPRGALIEPARGA